MKILWHSNAPWAPTGYGQQTNLFAPAIRDMGHEIALSCFYGLNGSRLDLDGMRLYPSGTTSSYGEDVIMAHAAHFFEGKASDGLILILTDSWVMPAERLARANCAVWVPIDHEQIPPKVRAFFETSGAIPIAMSRFGERLLDEAGFDPLYVPHGVDTELLQPLDRVEAREALQIPGADERFIVGMVAANKGWPSRKGHPEAIAAFARFQRRHPEALLYLHCEARGVVQGVNLPEILASLDVPADAVAFVDQYQHHALGGMPAEYMKRAYNSFDVFLNPAMGEGFGIPIVEAQACGTPVIVGDNTAQAELCGEGWKVGGQAFWSLQEAWQTTASIDEIEQALEDAHAATRSPDSVAAIREKARHFAEGYDAKMIAENFWPATLDRIERRIEGGDKNGRPEVEVFDLADLEAAKAEQPPTP